MDMQSTTDTYGDLMLSVDNTIFNRNWISISIHDYQPAYDPLSTPYPFSVWNTLFTCRDIRFTPASLVWDDLPTVKYTSVAAGTTFPNTPPVMSEPYIDET